VAPSPLHDFHAARQARFTEIRGGVLVRDYGDVVREHRALSESVGLIDLSSHTRLWITGRDHLRFLQGQVTNDVQRLEPGQGCHAAQVDVRGRLQADLHLYRLPDGMLLEAEPGLTQHMTTRFQKYVFRAEVVIRDLSSSYGLLSLQGPRAQETLRRLSVPAPVEPLRVISFETGGHGLVHCIRRTRLRVPGYDLFVPLEALRNLANGMARAVAVLGGRLCGWQALELARVEAGRPRFGQDMDERHLPLECGLEETAVSFDKGCYLGQEILARVMTYGEPPKKLCGLEVLHAPEELLPSETELHAEKGVVGYVTSLIHSPKWNKHIGLGYLRRGYFDVGTTLHLHTARGPVRVRVVPLPFDFPSASEMPRA